MDGLPFRKDQFAVAPMCLLYVNSSKQLVPIAIQLRQGMREEDKKEPNPIFLPSDGWYAWLLAKIYYRSAHGQVSGCNEKLYSESNYLLALIAFCILSGWITGTSHAV